MEGVYLRLRDVKGIEKGFVSRSLFNRRAGKITPRTSCHDNELICMIIVTMRDDFLLVSFYTPILPAESAACFLSSRTIGFCPG